MTMNTPSYLGETIEYSSLHACRSTLEDPTDSAVLTLVHRLIEITRLATPQKPHDSIVEKCVADIQKRLRHLFLSGKERGPNVATRGHVKTP